jgi:hypothetical protein
MVHLPTVVGILLCACWTSLVSAENDVILNIPSGAPLTGEPTEPPYLHNPPGADSHVQPQDIQAPAAFGERTTTLSRHELAPGSASCPTTAPPGDASEAGRHAPSSDVPRLTHPHHR